jgi:hypothetical protein
MRISQTDRLYHQGHTSPGVRSVVGNRGKEWIAVATASGSIAANGQQLARPRLLPSDGRNQQLNSRYVI